MTLRARCAGGSTLAVSSRSSQRDSVGFARCGCAARAMGRGASIPPPSVSLPDASAKVAHSSPTTSSGRVEAADDFHNRFVVQEDLSDATFMQKLDGQLANAPRETVLLAADIVYVNCLPSTT